MKEKGKGVTRWVHEILGEMGEREKTKKKAERDMGKGT